MSLNREKNLTVRTKMVHNILRVVIPWNKTVS